jgi:hypothetical protein
VKDQEDEDEGFKFEDDETTKKTSKSRRRDRLMTLLENTGKHTPTVAKQSHGE